MDFQLIAVRQTLIPEDDAVDPAGGGVGHGVTRRRGGAERKKGSENRSASAGQARVFAKRTSPHSGDGVRGRGVKAHECAVTPRPLTPPKPVLDVPLRALRGSA